MPILLENEAEGLQPQEEKQQIITADNIPSMAQVINNLHQRIDNLDEVLEITNRMQADFIQKINELGGIFTGVRTEVFKMKRFIESKYSDEYINFEKP
jgi:hypothetical protein